MAGSGRRRTGMSWSSGSHDAMFELRDLYSFPVWTFVIRLQSDHNRPNNHNLESFSYPRIHCKPGARRRHDDQYSTYTDHGDLGQPSPSNHESGAARSGHAYLLTQHHRLRISLAFNRFSILFENVNIHLVPIKSSLSMHSDLLGSSSSSYSPQHGWR